MLIEPEYEIGEIVYLITDPDQRARVVYGINIRPGGSLIYSLGMGAMFTEHYGLEISAEQDLTMKTND